MSISPETHRDGLARIHLHDRRIHCREWSNVLHTTFPGHGDPRRIIQPGASLRSRWFSHRLQWISVAWARSEQDRHTTAVDPGGLYQTQRNIKRGSAFPNAATNVGSNRYPRQISTSGLIT